MREVEELMQGFERKVRLKVREELIEWREWIEWKRRERERKEHGIGG